MTIKGQVALEFFLTYGWAILVVLIIFASLAYFGVFSLDNFDRFLNQTEEEPEEEPKQCIWVCISIDGTNFTNIQGCYDEFKKVPSMSTCAEFYGTFKINEGLIK